MEHDSPSHFIIQLPFIITVIQMCARVGVHYVACQEFISSENDYIVCIQNSGFRQLWPRVYTADVCARARARSLVALNANLNLTVGGRRCFSYIKVAVSHGKLQLWGFKAETASILLEGFARLVNFCDKSTPVSSPPVSLSLSLSVIYPVLCDTVNYW